MTKDKESTLRICLYRELKNVINVFTMETSFCGCDKGPFKKLHFTVDDYMNMGRDLLLCMMIYFDVKSPSQHESWIEYKKNPTIFYDFDFKQHDLMDINEMFLKWTDIKKEKKT